jgi:hypothetical protein
LINCSCCQDVKLFYCCSFKNVTIGGLVLFSELSYIYIYLFDTYNMYFNTQNTHCNSGFQTVSMSLWRWSLRTKTCKGMKNWNKKNLHQSHWMELFYIFIICIIVLSFMNAVVGWLVLCSELIYVCDVFCIQWLKKIYKFFNAGFPLVIELLQVGWCIVWLMSMKSVGS